MYTCGVRASSPTGGSGTGRAAIWSACRADESTIVCACRRRRPRSRWVRCANARPGGAVTITGNPRSTSAIGTYAAHLARAYLQQTAGGKDALAALPQMQEATGTAQRGLDYYGARRYEPGDPLRDVFWKHTLKLRQLVVKERRSPQGEAVILAVNVWASTADDLDQTAYRTVVGALTLAREDVPMVFAAYTDEAIVSVTPVLSPRQAVLHALHLVGAMRQVARPTRVLQAAQLARLRRRVERLLASIISPAARLARVLQFEYRAHVTRAQQHPGYQAVLKASGYLFSPAALLVTSSGPDDPEAIELALEHLRIRGVHALTVPRAGGAAV